MKVLVTGCAGQLGYDVCLRLDALGIDNKGVDVVDFDITDPDATRTFICEYRPDVVVHCAAFTAVNRAETERELCRRVNVDGTRNIAQACSEVDAAMLYVSTDYVFSGEGDQPFETDAPKSPNMVYGMTKSAGEDEVLRALCRFYIVRTSWVYGRNGGNFVYTMLRLGRERDRITVVNDQIGSPTYTVDLARLICDIIRTNRYGVYHATNEGFCSWYEFTCRIMQLAGLRTEIVPVTSEQYPQPVKRPLNSRLSKRSLDEAGFERLPDWQDALERFVPIAMEKNA